MALSHLETNKALFVCPFPRLVSFAELSSIVLNGGSLRSATFGRFVAASEPGTLHHPSLPFGDTECTPVETAAAGEYLLEKAIVDGTERGLPWKKF